LKRKQDAVSEMPSGLTKESQKNDTRIRMTDDEVKMLNYCCEKTGLNKTEVINLGIRKVYEEVKHK